jgi:hypothetical protein
MSATKLRKKARAYMSRSSAWWKLIPDLDPNARTEAVHALPESVTAGRKALYPRNGKRRLAMVLVPAVAEARDREKVV